MEYAPDWSTEFWDPMDASQKPVRCFSCSRVLGHKYSPYWYEIYCRGQPTDRVLAALDIDPISYCCKQMLMSYVSIPVQSVAKGKKIVCTPK